MISPELKVMMAPLAAYRRLADATRPNGWLARPAFVALLVGSIACFGTTGGFTLRLLPSAVFCWSFVPALQIALATPLIALGRRRPLAFSSAVDLFFMGHGPWSLWLLVVAAYLAIHLPLGSAALTSFGSKLMWSSAVVPLLWTCTIVFGFCRGVLGLGRHGALFGTLSYEIAVCCVAAAYVELTTHRLLPPGWR